MLLATQPTAQTRRLFIAIELPPAWHDAIAREQSALKAKLAAHAQLLRWVRPERAHLTLVFLGATPADREAGIGAAMEAAAAGIRPFKLHLGGPGTFGSRRPRVVWTAVDGDIAVLELLHRRLVVELGLTDDNAGRFSSHITLARVANKSGVGPRSEEVAQALAAALAQVKGEPVSDLAVTSISLMQSALIQGGAVYTRRYSAALSKV
jgi:2'-5' RNA ligase